MAHSSTTDIARKQEFSWFAVGLVFICAGIVMLFGEQTRMAGLPFLVLGPIFVGSGFDARRKRVARSAREPGARSTSGTTSAPHTTGGPRGSY